MTPYTPSSSYSASVSLFDTTDVVQGGLSGTSNIPIKELADNVKYLYDKSNAPISLLTLNDTVSTTINLAAGQVTGTFVVFSIITSSVNAVLQIQDAQFSQIPDNAVFTLAVLNSSGTVRPLQLKLFSNVIEDNGGPSRDNVYLYSGETMTFHKFGSSLRVLHHRGNYYNVGTTKMSYHMDNRLGWVERNGALLTRSEYPRLFEFVNRLNNASSFGVIDEVNWSSNKTYFSMGTTSSNFRIPDDTVGLLQGQLPLIAF